MNNNTQKSESCQQKSDDSEKRMQDVDQASIANFFVHPKMECIGKKNMQGLIAQLDAIFTLAPGKHEIHVLGLIEKQIFQGNVFYKHGKHLAIGLPSNTKEAIDCIVNFFASFESQGNGWENCVHNLCIRTNSVAENFTLPFFYRDIGVGAKKFSATAVTKDENICAINSFVIDIDRAKKIIPRNEAGIELCASNADLLALNQYRLEIVAMLSQYGLTPTYQVLTGNGYQMAYFFEHQIGTELVEKAKKTVGKILGGLNKKYLGTIIEIDTTLQNPSRLTRLACTANVKIHERVEQPPERVFRVASLIECTKKLNRYADVVRFAEILPDSEPQHKEKTSDTKNTENKEPSNTATVGTKKTRIFSGSFDSLGYVREIISLNSLAISSEENKDGGLYLHLAECVFNSSHSNAKCASFFIRDDGMISYKCQHESCKGKHWAAVKNLLQLPAKKNSVCKFCGKEICFQENREHKILPKNLDGTAHRCKKTQSTETQEANYPVWMNAKGKIITGLVAKEYLARPENIDNLVYSENQFFRYANGIWQVENEKKILVAFQQMIGLENSTKRVLEDAFFNLSLLSRKEIVWNPFPTKLCFKNCVLDTKTWAVETHNRELYQTNQLNYEFDSTFFDRIKNEGNVMDLLKAAAPNFHYFLASLGFQDEKTKQCLSQWFGYTLVPNAKMEAMLYLNGNGANGKGTLFRIWQALLGKPQYATLRPEEMFEPFRIIELQNKLVNFANDIDPKIEIGARIKSVVSGEEIQTRKIYGEEIRFIPYARFIFSGNGFVRTSDRSYGFLRRFHVLTFGVKFDSKKKDLDLFEKIEKEMPYVLYWALAGLKSLQNNNWHFIETLDFSRAKSEYEKEISHVAQFLDDEYTITQAGADCIPCAVFRTNYNAWCKENGYQVFSDVNLGKELLRLGVKKMRLTKEGTKVYCYCGIKKGVDEQIPKIESLTTVSLTADEIAFLQENYQAISEGDSDAFSVILQKIHDDNRLDEAKIKKVMLEIRNTPQNNTN